MSFEPKQFGRFYLLERLAMGGMAEIYKAKTFGAEGFEKLLAIKRILPHCAADQDFIRMLIDEAKLSVLLSHANIVQVYDLGKVGDDFFISMEFINGVNLRELLYRLRDAKRPLPVDLTVFMLSEVCKGLDYAHRKLDPAGNPLQIVHRDVSPQNILMSYEGEVKLVDFGIAKAAMNMSHTMAGILKGKISYMSPEQALGKQITHHTDIFSVGLILYECLTGQKMFSGESQFEVLKKIRTTKITAAKLPETIPPPLRDIIARALAYFPKDRYASAGDMQSDLTRYLYSTFHDFTPQRLAAFVRELFAEELTKQLQRANAQYNRDQHTGSIAAHESDDTAKTHMPTGQAADVSQPSIPMPPMRALDALDTPTPHVARRFAMIMALLGVLGIGALGTLYVQFPTWFRPPATTDPAPSGSVILSSTPPGAQILLDDQPMDSVTPATLSQLPLHVAQQITVRMDGYRDVTQTLTLSSATPTTIHLTLPAAMGTLVLTSTPPGATVWINDTEQAGVTPLTLNTLPISTPLKVRIAAEGFFPHEESLLLPGTDPHTLNATLTAALPTPPEKIEAIALPDSTPPPIALPVAPTAVPPEPTIPSAPPPTAAPDIKKKPVVEAPGSIRVETTPAGATILLNGRNTGKTTPDVLSNLSAHRRYTVTVRKKDYQGWSRTIRVESDKQITLSQAIAPVPSRTPPPPPDKVITTTETATIKKNGAAELEQTKTTTTTVNTAGYGSITINSKPRGASVTVDGRALGRAPITIQGVSVAKPHAVKLSLPGYRPWSTSVKVEINSEAMIFAPLQKLGE